MIGTKVHAVPDQRRLQSTWQHTLILYLATLGCYALLALIVTWPLALHFDQFLFGGIDGAPGRFAFAGGEEAGLHLWHLWWVSEAILNGVNPFWTDLLFYPDGVQLYVQTLSAPNAALALPIYLLAGPVAAFNAAVLLGFALTGFGVFLLTYHYVRGFWEALVCGMLITLGPLHIAQLQNSHLHLFSLHWIPFYAGSRRGALAHCMRCGNRRAGRAFRLVLGVDLRRADDCMDGNPAGDGLRATDPRPPLCAVCDGNADPAGPVSRRDAYAARRITDRSSGA